MNQTKIAAHLQISRKQVGHSLRRGSVTPKEARGQISSLSSEEVDKVEEFVKSSLENRQMTYFELLHGEFKHLGVSERMIKKELEKKGYNRHLAIEKPIISPKIKRERKECAEAHIDWTTEQWVSILWSDETLATDHHHSRRLITRRVSKIPFRSE